MAVVVLAAFIATYVVLQPERFTALLQSRARAAGLELSLSSPASPTLWPKPALELEGLTLRAESAGVPMIVASRGKLVLPWSTLTGGDTRISRLEVEGARIDLDAVSAYLDTLPSRPSTAGAILPSIDAGFRITRGTLTRGNSLFLSDVNVDAGRLDNGRPFTLSLAASASEDTTFVLDLETTPTLARGVLTLEDLVLRLSDQPSVVDDPARRGDMARRRGRGRVTFRQHDAHEGNALRHRAQRHPRQPAGSALRVDKAGR